MLRRPRADVRMGLHGDVCIYPYANRHNLLPFRGDCCNLFQLHLRFYVQGADIGFQCGFYLVAQLTHTGVDDFVRGKARVQCQKQLAAAGDVGAQTGFGQQAQDGRVAVGLDGVANQRIVTGLFQLRLSVV